VPGVENYQRHPGKKLERVLATCEWEQVGPGLWWKGNSRLYVDAVGVFFYQHTSCHQWVRTHGLSHNLIFPRINKITFRDLSTLDLLTGEFSCLTEPNPQKSWPG
jgi:hypothetical protein